MERDAMRGGRTVHPEALAAAWAKWARAVVGGADKSLESPFRRHAAPLLADLRRLAHQAGGVSDLSLKRSRAVVVEQGEGQDPARHHDALRSQLFERLRGAEWSLSQAADEGKLGELACRKDETVRADQVAALVDALERRSEELQEVVAALGRPGADVQSLRETLLAIEVRVSDEELEEPPVREEAGAGNGGASAPEPFLARAAALLDALGRGEPEPEPEPEPPPLDAHVREAAAPLRKLLGRLVDEGKIELSEGASVDALALDALDAMDRIARDPDPSGALYTWLLDQDAVEEMYLDELELREALRRGP